MNSYVCAICGHHTENPGSNELGSCRGNTVRFRDQMFHLWKCPKCHSIHNVDPVDFADIYHDYPLNKRKLDIYARGTLKNLLKRLQSAGLSGKSASILDYGCGNGVFLQFLKEIGYHNIAGYDPFVDEYKDFPNTLFDCVVANDVIEHVPDPRTTIKECASFVKPGGLLYLGTADSEPVNMNNLEPHIMRLHQPFHRIIITQESLHQLAKETGMELVNAYRRSYMDTLMPFSNYRFLDEFNRELGHTLDSALDPKSASIVPRKPMLLFYGLFGYFFPSAYEPAVLLRKPVNSVQ